MMTTFFLQINILFFINFFMFEKITKDNCSDLKFKITLLWLISNHKYSIIFMFLVIICSCSSYFYIGVVLYFQNNGIFSPNTHKGKNKINEN